MDVHCVVPWSQWLEQLQRYRGIAFDKGFIPLEAIAWIVHINPQGETQMTVEGNVVPFKR
jgi:hypothetical protein